MLKRTESAVKPIFKLTAVCAALLCGTAHAYDVTEKSISQLQADLQAGRVTSVELVRLYEARIAGLNPKLHAVIALNPAAPAQARAADAARKAHAPYSALAGIPILLKDNIESADPVATTAGSLALAGNVTGRDAPLVARLRAAGAIILGKTNLSEWANIRSSNSISGWSATGGQARNPYALDRNTCGSSAGSGAASAASLAAATIGTETDGSVTCPSAINGLVGLKPTVGLVSRTHVVPISHSQDTAGPMTRDVMDAAIVLGGMAGSDPADPATAHADVIVRDFTTALSPIALRGVRIGVMRFAAGFHPETEAVFERALVALRAAGATLVDIKQFPGGKDLGAQEHLVLMTELKADLNAYLAATDPAKVPSRSLADLIAFNATHADREMPLFGQDQFVEAEATNGLADPVYVKASADARRGAGVDGIDAMLADNRVSVLIAPTLGPSWLIDPILKDHFSGGGAGAPAAIAGYPHLTVPMGLVDGLPVGLSFIGAAWSDAKLLAYGYAYEQATLARRAPLYLPTAEIPRMAAPSIAK
ncbi:amidase [Sphingomonas psychrolutea]|uniref:Amidase n=1 Tax=Sphingomonas psychrolutea TaxID=1259676 RepID=A0ABQ1H6L7_9SPHN|nr:amidase [Sphingomonas psychrolutea]